MPYLVVRLPGLVCAVGEFTEETTVYPLYAFYALLPACALFAALSLVIIRAAWAMWWTGNLFILMREVRAMRSKDVQRGLNILKDTYDTWLHEHADDQKLRKFMCGTYLGMGRLLRNIILEEKNQKSDEIVDGILVEGNCLKFEAAVKCDPQNAMAWHHWGIALEDFAAKEGDADRKRHLLGEACEKHAQAAQLDPEAPWVWGGWGGALCRLADLDQDEVRKRELLEEACRKLETATTLKPDNVNALDHWGYALLVLARLEEDDDRKRELLEGACEKLATSVKHNPAIANSWSNWAIATARLSEMEEDAARRGALIKDSLQRFSESVIIDPKLSMTWCNWGLALGHFADLEEDTAKKREMLGEACETFQKSTEHNPGCGATWHGWGISLDRIADIEEAENHPEKARQLREAAEVKYERAEGIKPGITLYNRACDHALRGDKETCRELLARAEQAGVLPGAEHLRSDSDMDSVRGEAWFVELLARREQAEGEQAED